MGLKKSQDIDIDMERKNITKKINLKLGLKKSQDIKSKKYIYIYKEPMSKEGPVFPIFKRRNIKKKPTIIGKPKKRMKKPTIIFNKIDGRKRYVNPITQKLVFRPTYLAALRRLKKKDEELQRKFDEVSQKIERRSMMKSHGFL